MNNCVQWPSTQVTVIGSGIAGLAAAHYLANAGISDNVLEASARVGGQMTTDTVTGFRVDRGARLSPPSIFTANRKVRI